MAVTDGVVRGYNNDITIYNSVGHNYWGIPLNTPTFVDGHQQCLGDELRLRVIRQLEALDKVVDHLEVRIALRGEEGGNDTRERLDGAPHLWDTDQLPQALTATVKRLEDKIKNKGGLVSVN